MNYQLLSTMDAGFIKAARSFIEKRYPKFSWDEMGGSLITVAQDDLHWHFKGGQLGKISVGKQLIKSDKQESVEAEQLVDNVAPLKRGRKPEIVEPVEPDAA